MCGRYTLATPNPAEVRARFAIGESLEVRRRYNVAPGDDVLAVTADREGVPRGQLLRWGFVPSWAEKPETGLKMINARIETVAAKPAFRRAYDRFRCLIIADGFYEWRTVPGAPKQPFHITRVDRQLFAFAGLWSIWYDGGGSKLRSCTILTRPANSILAPLHDRMPVILHPDAEAAWLDSGTPVRELPSMLSSLDAEQTELQPVGTAVNDARYDGPECLAPPVHSAPAPLF